MNCLRCVLSYLFSSFSFWIAKPHTPITIKILRVKNIKSVWKFPETSICNSHWEIIPSDSCHLCELHLVVFSIITHKTTLLLVFLRTGSPLNSGNLENYGELCIINVTFKGKINLHYLTVFANVHIEVHVYLDHT